MSSLHGKLHHFPGASVDLTDPRIGILLPDLVMTRCGGIDRMLFAEALETMTRRRYRRISARHWHAATRESSTAPCRRHPRSRTPSSLAPRHRGIGHDLGKVARVPRNQDPPRRLMTLEEIVNVAVFMASDKASGMTGTTVNLTMGSLDD